VFVALRLTTGILWSIPITLDVSDRFVKSLKPKNSKVALRDAEGVMLAVLNVEEIWQSDRNVEAAQVFGTTSPRHPGVDYLLNKANRWYVGGIIEGLRLPSVYDFKSLRSTPAELRAEFDRLGWRRVVAFQTRNPMHRAHVKLTFRAAKQVEASFAKARAGILKDFTGVSDPYEEPKDAEIVINTADVTPEEAAQAIMLYMEREGYLGVNGGP
jgi:sulfate adenylyltransferase